MLLRTPDKKAKLEEKYVYSVPGPDEIAFVGRANEECYYYARGLEACRDAVHREFVDRPDPAATLDASRCKDVLDSYFNCATFDHFGSTVDDVEDAARPYLRNYTSCLFGRNETRGLCRKYFDDVLRYYFRKPESPLKNI